MITRPFLYLVCIACMSYASVWIETTQDDFADGIFERNIYASHLDGGAVEFTPRFDLNNDGYIDLFTADRDGPYVKVFWGSASGYSPGLVTMFPSSGAGNCDAADIDDDGYADFIVTHRNTPKLTVYWGSPTGPNPYNYSDIMLSQVEGEACFIADFNKDGYLDIAMDITLPGYGSVFWGSASGFNFSNRIDLPVQMGQHNIEVADFNKDDWLDVLFVAATWPTETYRIYWGASTGFSPINFTSFPAIWGSHGVAVADLNSDAFLDIVYTYWYDPAAHIYWGDSTGYSTSNMQVLNPGYCYGGSAAADINEDGYLDIVFHRGGYGIHEQEIYWGSAAGYQNSNMSYIGIPIEASGGLITDFDCDGDLDIFSNTITPGFFSYVFWGSGFTTYTELSVNYDHHAMFREIGNVYDRNYNESYISSVFDAGQTSDWGTVEWDDSLPSGTSIECYVRSGNTPSYDPTWSGWCMLDNGDPVPDSLNSRYIQYMVLLHYTNPAWFPCLYAVSISYYLGDYIAVTSPNGGECWIRGNSYDITWMSSGVSGDVKIELYKGGVYNSTIASNTANSGSYSWTIPAGQLPGTDYQLKITSVSDPSIFDFSNGQFSICSQIVVTVPNGGETWHIGESHDITWAPSGIGGNVVIEYSTNGGSNWLIINFGTLDDGIYTWSVPNTPTTEGRVKVTHLAYSANYDESDWDFTIPPLAIEESQSASRPTVFSVQQNYPNPSSGITLIRYAIPKPCRVEIRLYDVTGKEIALIMDKNLSYGYYQTSIDIDDISGRKLSNGVYFYRFRAGDYVETKSMMVAR